ncbi:hypothetical protein Natoc_3388 [Natronococcus occultus SP4]|uniref:Uncharacterized protein n=1 Tax=Natronococcus occultus SP4 TaxID=694430 RepID=L0K3I5_9EURY|nr:hypothetical protein Natoc_3388 [Natronococcus occultus SP4]
MARRDHPGDRGSASEPKFYLPGGDTPPFYAGRFERLWASLFNYDVESR